MRFIIHVFLWLSSLIFGFVLYPIKWIGYFKKSKKCPPINDDLLLVPALTLGELIRTKQISSKHVIETYINRIKEVNPILNAIVQERFDAALTDAINVDKFLSETMLNENELKCNYPLLGLPITIKETVGLKGLSFNGGVKTKHLKIAKNDNDAIKQIKTAGGIPLLVSNTPELCLNWETCNKQTGITVNPYDTRRTCGGSSGGEAVLLSTASSILGLGSDLCGSIRLPSHFCGIFGHKPTGNCVSINETIPYTNKPNPLFNIAFTVGPLTRYACDLNLLFDVILKPEMKVNFPQIDVPVKTITIYYMEFDGNACMTHVVQNEIVRTMRRVIEQFKLNGHQTEKVKLKRMSDSIDLAFLPLLSISGVQTVFNDQKRNLFKEIILTFVGRSNVQPTTILFALVYKIAQRLITKRRRENIMKEIEAFRNDISDLLGSNGVLLYPVFPTVAHYHSEIYSKTLDTSYLTIFNTLGVPATSCPVGVDSKGLPIGLQVVGNFKMDRLCFKIAEEIEREFGGWRQPPFQSTNN
ncbi:fatty-acid amide hydrolase 2-B-like [Onthophagus taurus]|uniref:fatty-acid amide hydrolase 2-B-like n=1 Tax=Onthophagus taurus TaxID=166361 RepID=UPI0039BE7E32